MARTIADPAEESLYEELNRGLAALRRGDVGAAMLVLSRVSPRVVRKKVHRADAAAIALLEQEIALSGGKA